MDFATFRPGNQMLVGTLRAAPVYLSYPTIIQRELIPDDVFTAVNARWTGEYMPPKTAEFYRLKEVFVVAEGLVFTKAGELVEGSQNAHSDAEVVEARDRLAVAMSSGQDIPSIARALLCKQRGTGNYGHWIVESLPKAFLARRALGIVDWPVIVHRSSDEMVSVIKQSLASVSVGESQIAFTDGAPVYVDELIMVCGLTNHSVYISPLVMECMDHIASRVSARSMSRIYAPRRPATTRDFENEPEIAEVFRDHGYQEVLTANLSFLEQVAAFKSAERVVGPMGAALTNMIFCRPGAEVTIFGPAGARELFFWQIANGKNLRYAEVRCEEVGEQTGFLPWDRTMRISASKVREVMSRISSVREMALIPLDVKAQVQATPILDEALLSNRSWVWRFDEWHTGDFVAPVHSVGFLEDGSLSGYSHPNERGWRMHFGCLEILDDAGRCSWRFDCASIVDGRLKMRSRYQLDPMVKVVLIIEETFTDAAAE